MFPLLGNALRNRHVKDLKISVPEIWFYRCAVSSLALSVSGRIATKQSLL